MGGRRRAPDTTNAKRAPAPSHHPRGVTRRRGLLRPLAAIRLAACLGCGRVMSGPPIASASTAWGRLLYLPDQGSSTGDPVVAALPRVLATRSGCTSLHAERPPPHPGPRVGRSHAAASLEAGSAAAVGEVRRFGHGSASSAGVPSTLLATCQSCPARVSWVWGDLPSPWPPTLARVGGLIHGVAWPDPPHGHRPRARTCRVPCGPADGRLGHHGRMGERWGWFAGGDEDDERAWFGGGTGGELSLTRDVEGPFRTEQGPCGADRASLRERFASLRRPHR